MKRVLVGVAAAMLCVGAAQAQGVAVTCTDGQPTVWGTQSLASLGLPNPCDHSITGSDVTEANPSQQEPSAGIQLGADGDALAAGIERTIKCIATGKISSGQTAGPNDCVLIVGRCAGYNLTGAGRDVLIGDYTNTPKPTSQGFINIGNKFCAWIDAGKVAPCPPPVSLKECE